MYKKCVFYDELISVYKKEYNQAFKNIDKDWRHTHDYKNLKDLDYQTDQLQPDQPQQLDQSQQPDQLMLGKWVKVTKSRFNVIQSITIEAINNKLKTIVDRKIIQVWKT